MAQKAANEFAPRQGLVLAASTVLVVLPGKSHRPLLAINLQDALVAHGNPAGVARQIAHHRARAAQSRLAVDVPASGREHLTPATPLFHTAGLLGPDDLRTAIKLFKATQKDRAENLHHGPHREEIVGPRLLPATALQVHSAATDQTVQMGMPVQGTSPGMEHPKESALAFPVLALEGFESFGGSVEEKFRGDAVVVLKELPHFPGQGKDDMKMRAVRETFANLLGPLGLPRSQAGRTMAVAAGTGIPLPVMAVATLGVIVTEGPVTAMRHQVEPGVLLVVQPAGPEIAPFTKNAIDRRFDAVTLNMYQTKTQ